MKWFALALVSILCAGCSSTYTWQDGGKAKARLPGRSVYVAVPANGRFEETTYEKSGEQTADAVVAAIAPHVDRVVRGTAPESVDDAVKHARDGGFAYVVVPTILHWEDRATEWSMLRDEIEIRLDIIDAPSSRVLQSTSFTGKSPRESWGGDHPQDLLREPLDAYMGSLF